MPRIDTFDDFSIEVHGLAEGRFQTTLRTAAQTEAARPFVLPLDSEALRTVLAGLDLATPETSRDLGGKPSAEQLQPSAREIGSELFRVLFPGDIGRIFEQGRARADDVGPDGSLRGIRLRLRLNLEDEQVRPLAALPWELLHDPLDRTFFGQGRLHLLVRQLASTVPVSSQPLRTDLPLRILAVAASPRGLPSLDLDAESRQLQETLQAHKGLRISFLPHATLDRLQEALRHERPHILHFMGHGSFDPASGEGCLLFEDDHGGQEPAGGEILSEMLKDFRHLRLIVLNACRTAQMPGSRAQAPYATLGAELSRAGIPAVVAMQFPVSDPGAIRFSKVFYGALAEGDPVDVAVGEGRRALYRLGYRSRSLEWAAPVLLLRSGDGRLFDLPAAGPQMEAPESASPQEEGMTATQTPEKKLLRLGIRSRVGYGDLPENTLDLTRHFDDSFIRDPALWNAAVLPELAAFLRPVLAGGQPLFLDFAAHASLAFTAGYVLEAKSGLDVMVRQRLQKGGFRDWQPEDSPLPEGPFWKAEEDRILNAEASDVAVAVGLTWPVLDDVQLYLEREHLPVRRLLPATIAPEPGSTAVHGGAHALALAQALALRIRARTLQERLGTLHLFVSGPNAFLFYLGQLARGLGRIQLYEYDFASGRPGAYRASILLSPEERPWATS